MIDERTERKMGRRILEKMREIRNTPQDNTERFRIAHKQLRRAVEKYKAATGRDTLLPNVDYGYTIN